MLQKNATFIIFLLVLKMHTVLKMHSSRVACLVLQASGWHGRYFCNFTASGIPGVLFWWALAPEEGPISSVKSVQQKHLPWLLLPLGMVCESSHTRRSDFSWRGSCLKAVHIQIQTFTACYSSCLGVCLPVACWQRYDLGKLDEGSRTKRAEFV